MRPETNLPMPNQTRIYMSGKILRMNEGDAAVDRGATALSTDTGYPIVLESQCVGKNELLSGIQRTEKLIIHGHGSTTKIGKKTAIQMAQLLADSGLTGPVVIELMACKGGMTGAPFALELKLALVQGHKIMCSVSGAKGVLSRNRATNEWSVKPNPQTRQPLGPATTYQTTCSF